jgi:murein DD-endopeptidase MepM/ murein hydrolase activator NlpD
MPSAGSPLSSRRLTALRARFVRPRASRTFALALFGSAGTVLVPAAADASSGGGVSINPSAATKAGTMLIRKISCVSGCTSIAQTEPGATLRFQGPMLTQGKRVVYLGGAGTADDVLAHLTIKKSGKAKVATALVPKRAASGPVAIEIAAGARSKASAQTITLPAPAKKVTIAAPLDGQGPFFPIRGNYKFGTGVAAFGGARHHEGEDIFAKCGTPLVAAESGKVLANTFQSRAGNYLVIDVIGDTHDEAYMHLRDPALPKIGDDVVAGTQIGFVGQTGHADGCHLHFELWDGHWQGVGGPGTAVDPLPTLKDWAAGPGAVKTAR